MTKVYPKDFKMDKLPRSDAESGHLTTQAALDGKFSKKEAHLPQWFWVCVPIFLFLAYGVWNLSRLINYNFQYRSDVEATIRELVKPEALKE